MNKQPRCEYGVLLQLSGGGEKEAHTASGGRFTAEALGVLPLMPNFGLQGAVNYVGGLGSRIGFNVAPVLAWDGGKLGAFVAYQHRGLRSTDFVYLIPSVALYLPQATLNLWYSQPLNGAQRGGHRVAPRPLRRGAYKNSQGTLVSQRFPALAASGLEPETYGL